jgi:hypothetical protein
MHGRGNNIYREDTVYYLVPSILVQDCSVRTKTTITFGNTTEMCACFLDPSDVELICALKHEKLVEFVLYITRAEECARSLCMDVGMHTHTYSIHTQT